MAGPWEKYQQPTGAAAGPWTKYQDQSAAQAPSDAQVVEEMHPSLSSVDRLVVKNLANSPEAAAGYLKKQYPGLDVQVKDGRPIMKGLGDKEYRVVDPDTGFFSKDILNDAGDLIWDTGAGVVEGAATAPFVATGNVPGAVAAGGLSAAGMEALRQKLGAWAGVPQEVNGTDVLFSGGMGAAMPAVGGLVGKAYKGVTKNFTPWLGEKLSGVPRQAIKTAKEKLPGLESLNEAGVRDVAGEAQSLIKGGIAVPKRGAGKAMQAAEEAVDQGIDISEPQNQMKELIAAVREQAQQSGADVDQEVLGELEGVYRKHFMKKVETPAQKGLRLNGQNLEPYEIPASVEWVDRPGTVSPKEARALRDQMKAVSESYAAGQGPESRFAAGDSRISKIASEIFREGEQHINKQFNEGTEGLAETFRQKYRDASDMQKELQRYFGTKKQTYKSLSNLGSDPYLQDLLRDLKADYGVDIEEIAKLLESYKYFRDPAEQALSGFGTTSTSRTIGAGDLGSAVGGLMGATAGPGGGRAGAIAGRAVGSNLANPAMVLRSVRLGQSLEKGAKKAAPRLYGTGQGAWHLLYNKENRR
jgi:hypothetical protein